jgi:acetolactate synthase-1/2/3 large subunit
MHNDPSARPRASAARLFLESLKRHRVEHLFGNAGTDFAAIIEAYAIHPDISMLPKPVTVPHENLAVAMAHGAYLMSGRPQAVMVHVNVGTANAVCGLINATRERIPLLLCAGRNPITEEGSSASRNAFIHWAQEMFDQGAMVRELVKWDYELRRAEQTEIVVERAIAIAMAEPRGPVYLTLPREILSEEAEHALPRPHALAIAAPKADPESIAQAATWLKEARRPLIVAGSYGRTNRDRQALAAFVSRHNVPVVTERPRIMPIGSDNPAFIGFAPAAHIAETDLILALACDVPWIPRNGAPAAEARIVHISHDPLFSRYPLRSHRADLLLDGDPAATLAALAVASASKAALSERSRWRDGKRADFDRARQREVPMEGDVAYAAVAHALAWRLREGDIVVCETAFPLELLHLPDGAHYFGAPSAGGLGWALGAAIGAKIAAPESRVIALVGDGAYMFGNPTPAHYVSRAEGLPFLTVILNNSMWAAVRRATLAVYPQSVTKERGRAVFTSLEPSPAYEKVVEASDGLGACVERAEDIPAALDSAFAALEGEGRQAVLNIKMAR